MIAGKKLRVLLIESKVVDATRTLHALTQGGFEIEHLRVDQVETLQAALVCGGWDVILCSHNPLGFNGLSALKIVQEAGTDLPCLFLSYDLSEVVILEALRLGADDYIFSASLTLLAPSIKRNLRAAHIRRDHRLAQIALRDSRTQLQSFIANLPGMAYQLLRKVDGSFSFPYVSEGSLSVLGVSPESLKQSPHLILSLLHPEEHISYHQTMHESADNLTFWNWQGRIVTPQNGAIKWINLRCSPRKMEHGEIWWEGIMINITESKLAELEVLHTQDQIRELSMHILEVREQERLNIAREVHDQLGNMLTAIGLDIAWLKNRLNADSTHIFEKANLLAKFQDIENLLGKSIVVTHDIASALRPGVLDTFGIIAAIEVEVKEFEQRTDIACIFDAHDEGTEVSPDIAITLFRVMQELLSNCMKHARASQIKVSIHNSRDAIILLVRDNGRGFSDEDRRKSRSFGLRGIQERITHAGGEVLVQSTQGHGTVIRIYMPHPPQKMDDTEWKIEQQQLPWSVSPAPAFISKTGHPEMAAAQRNGEHSID
ncbi:MAG: ATP-binding protein [Candidatus Nitrotoga sp.]